MAAEVDERRTDTWALNLRDERDGVALYEGLAKIERDPVKAGAFEELATAERRHAAIWEKKLTRAGIEVPAARPSLRVRWLLWLARRFGVQRVLPMVIQGEGADIRKYAQQPRDGKALIPDEEAHQATLREMQTGAPPEPRTLILDRENWHRGRSGSIRAAVFGMNDGLVSNLALVLGVAGAGASGDALVVTGLAGLMAGAFSMGVGEYVSVASHRDLLRRQVLLETRELTDAPEEEEAELVQIYVRKGLGRVEAEQFAADLLTRPDAAVDTLVREELGLDPDDLGSPIGAAVSSFTMFAIGASMPVLPFLFLDGTAATVTSATVSAAVLATVGAVIALLSGTSPARGTLRMLVLAGLATAATVTIGWLVGAQLG